MKLALLALLFVVASACHDPIAGALAINDTDRAVTVRIAGSDDAPLVIEPGRDDFPQAPPGRVTLQFSAGEDRWEREVELTTRDLALVAVSPDGCIAVADYGDQYGGTGKVEVIATASPTQSGHISLDGELYFGVDDSLPKEIYPDTPVRRFTRVPCEVLADERALKAHLWALD